MLWIYHEYVHARSLQSYLTLGNPMDYSLLGSSVLGILSARILEWVAVAFSELSKQTIPNIHFSSVQFSSFTQSCPSLCDPVNCSTPGLPVHHHLLEFTQTHVRQVRDAIQPSHPRLSPSPTALNPSQNQSLFQ